MAQNLAKIINYNPQFRTNICKVVFKCNILCTNIIIADDISVNNIKNNICRVCSNFTCYSCISHKMKKCANCAGGIKIQCENVELNHIYTFCKMCNNITCFKHKEPFVASRFFCNENCRNLWYKN